MLAVLVVDVVLLALLELMFVTLSVGATPLPVSSLVALLSTPWLVRRALGREPAPEVRTCKRPDLLPID